MEPYAGEAIKVDISEQDIKLMDLVAIAFDRSLQLKPGIPSISREIKECIMGLIDSDTAAPNLSELFESQGTQEIFSMSSLLTSMLVSTIKQKHTTLGRLQPIFSEEVDLMLESKSLDSEETIERCLA